MDSALGPTYRAVRGCRTALNSARKNALSLAAGDGARLHSHMSFQDIQARARDLAGRFFDAVAGGEPMTAAAVAATLAALVFLGLYVAQRNRVQRLEIERERLTAVATRAKEILATAPDGLFLWDHILGGITCSRRLAVLLNLEGGIHARYDDIRACFEGESLKALERSVSSLRSNGTPFGILLNAGKRTLEAVGARAETEAGQPVADIVWVGDITEIAAGAPVPASGAATETPPAEAATGFDDRHLTALLNAMPFPVWLRDSGLKLAFANPAAEGIVDPDPKMAETARQQGTPFTERRLLDIGGTARLMDISEIALGAAGEALAAGEKPGGSLGFAVDRTEREQAAGAEQRQSQARNAVLETLGSAIAIFDVDKRLDFANAAFAELSGLERAWLADRPAFGAVLDRQREARTLPEVADFAAFKAEQAAQFTAVSEPVSDLMHLPDGRTIKRTVAPHMDGGLVFAFDDVSQQLGLERSVKEAGAVQRETLDNLSEGVAVFGSDGRLKLSNPVYGRLWGLDADFLESEPHVGEVVERTRKLLPPPDGAAAWTDGDWAKQRDLLAARMLSRAATQGQTTLANGTVVDHANVPLPDGAVLISYLDVTDTARVEAALRERAEAFQEADRLKTEFIANVSYEVRTPLNTIIGFADMLSQNLFGELNPRQSEYAKGILGTSRSLVSILGDILDLATIEAGRLELDKDTFDTHAFLVASLNLIRERARRKNLKVDFDCPPDIGWMIGDERRLKQVLFNVLSNAVTFTPPRGEIRLKARRQGAEMEFSVRDTGVGMPADGRDRLFRPFEQGAKPDAADDDTETSGTGLGLSIARNFIELHGGSIDMTSQPGRGTTVTCRLPAGNVGGGTAETAAGADTEPGPEKPSRPAPPPDQPSRPDQPSLSVGTKAKPKPAPSQPSLNLGTKRKAADDDPSKPSAPAPRKTTPPQATEPATTQPPPTQPPTTQPPTTQPPTTQPPTTAAPSAAPKTDPAPDGAAGDAAADPPAGKERVDVRVLLGDDYPEDPTR